MSYIRAERGNEYQKNMHLLFTFFLASFSCLLCAARNCRCLYGDSCFPNATVWSQFNQTLNGSLVHVSPTAYPCYSQDTARCGEIHTNWNNSLWRSSQPGTAEHPNWETYHSDKCILPRASKLNKKHGKLHGKRHGKLHGFSDSFGQCSQGSVPVYAVNATSVQDVQAALRFAALHNLRIVVKNTGHDYHGRSSGKGALSIWTHNMKTIGFDDNFHEYGCPTPVYTAVRVGAGVQWKEVYNAAHTNQRLVVGALSASVGAAGGYVQGGGHSPLSPTYGLAADNVLEFQVVLPDGTVRTASRCANRDLFWALCGGGGSTFGVVTSVVYRTYPAAENVLSVVKVIEANGTDSYQDLLARFASMHGTISRQGWAGYFVLSGNTMIMRYHVLNQSESFSETSFSGFNTYLQEHPMVRTLLSQTKSYPSFLDWYNDTMCAFYGATNCTDGVGVNRALVTRLVPIDTVLEYSSELAYALLSLLNGDGTTNKILGISVGGGAVSTRRDNAVNPAWRRSLWHITAEANWDDTDSMETVQEKLSKITVANSALRDLTPDSGSYFNEADFNEPDWQRSLFGSNYDRLSTLKKQYDPDELLVCWHCVGSDHWSDDLNCPV